MDSYSPSKKPLRYERTKFFNPKKEIESLFIKIGPLLTYFVTRLLLNASDFLIDLWLFVTKLLNYYIVHKINERVNWTEIKTHICKYTSSKADFCILWSLSIWRVISHFLAVNNSLICTVTKIWQKFFFKMTNSIHWQFYIFFSPKICHNYW